MNKSNNKFLKTVQVTGQQEALLDFFEQKGIDTAERIEALKWVFEATTFGWESPLGNRERNLLARVYELNTILEGIQQGY